MIELDDPDFVVVGAVGAPGERVFYLQAGVADRVALTVKLEKQQVAALAGALAEVLADLPPEPAEVVLDRSLREPVAPDWVAGTMALSNYDAATRRVTLAIEELVAEDTPGESARLGLTAGQMAALVERGAQLVAAGRPPCPFCGLPLDPDGHTCPKTNGHLER